MTPPVVITGESLGAVAAAFAAQSMGVDVRWVVPKNAVLGGQLTGEGVSAPDEHTYIETFASRRYLLLRDHIREAVMLAHNAPAVMSASILGPNVPLNPGNGWVSRLCFLPQYGVNVIAYHADVLGLTFRRKIPARYAVLVDGTPTGEHIRDVGAVIGAESQADTGEAHAPPDARPGEVQSFTYPFIVEYCPGEDHTIAPPPGYAENRDAGRYSLSLTGHDGVPRHFRMFADGENGELPFWSYRRLHDGALLGGSDLAMMNWHSNDYTGGGILGTAPAEAARHHQAAKDLALGFLYWLQTACPRDDGGTGYPELKLRPDLMPGSTDGLSAAPYLRETWRIIPRQRITESDISAEANPGARAAPMTDSVGIGWYALDVHGCAENPDKSLYLPTKPFQIPLGALIPAGDGRIIPGGKNIGTTHLTNGAYRVHHVEWAIGEAAGTLAAFCARERVTPGQVHDDRLLTWRLQYALVRQGVPIAWAVDVPPDHPLFLPTQLLLVQGILRYGEARWARLTIEPGVRLGRDIAWERLRVVIMRLGITPEAITPAHTWAAMCQILEPHLHARLQ